MDAIDRWVRCSDAISDFTNQINHKSFVLFQLQIKLNV